MPLYNNYYKKIPDRVGRWSHIRYVV